MTCVLMLAALAAHATTIVMPSDVQLIAKTPVIVEGVIAQTKPVDRDGTIWTETTLNVARVLKGMAADTITIREVGGTLDDRITKIWGGPEYTAGEHVLVFLNPTPRGDYQTTDLFAGKFTEESALNGQRLWFRDDIAEHVTLLDPNFNPVAARDVQRDAAGFETFVRERVAGRAGNPGYLVENPVLSRVANQPQRDGNFASPEGNFTLISEPTIYRWFAMDSGAAVRWVSYGTQPGYTGGGVNELTTAMSSWTGYSAAKITYTYGGSTTANPGGLGAANGVNEVVFNDPKGEISGSWNPSTGGVVGTGGFNGVSNGGNWTAPFTADSAHPAGAQHAYSITEGNLVIQDGVSATTGISSNKLAEIIAHEFGHTLGFGHSTDGTALMYYSVTGLGPSLRADDQVAARWLYPNGNVQPPTPVTVPASPSGLTATPSGQNVVLTWTDNANNETGESIYVASGSGAFSKITDLAAGTKTATLTGFTTGTYRIYVTAFNSAGESAPSNTASVTFGSTLAASFSFTPQTGSAGVTSFTFYDESTGGVISRGWNFGDGTTSSAAPVTHVFANAGTYTVTLTVSGSGGTQAQTSRTITVTGPLNAAFAYTPSNPTTDTTVAFADQSTGGITSWAWNFGDGGASSAQNPVHRFANAGTYTVSLTAYRNSETSFVSKSITVTSPVPAGPAVTAAFAFNPSSPGTGTTVTFFDQSSGSPTSWRWSFGDGANAAEQNPTHAYAAAGTYTVSLTASNGGSSASVSKQIVVTQITPYRALVSAAAQTNGAGGSVWRTELSIFNAGDEVTFVDAIYIPSAGGSVQTRRFSLSPAQAITYANALSDIFGITNGAGAIALEANGTNASPRLRVTSRTFTNGALGTYGQAVPTVDGSGLVQTLYLTGIQSNNAYRTNIGLVNRTGNAVAATLTLYDASGSQVTKTTLTLPANNFQQSLLTALFPATASRTYDVLSMRVDAATSGAVSAYASIVDNATQDPVYLQAMRLPSGGSMVLPAAGRAPGANGTFWHSDVTLYNPTGNRLFMSLRYLPAGADNRNPSSKSLSLANGETVVLEDILQQMGVTSGSGALEIDWNGDTGPLVTSRTYTPAPGGGTYGQSIDPIVAYGSDVYVPGLRSDASFRANAGFVNGSTDTIVAGVRVLSSAGAELASTTLSLAPKSQLQYALSALFPGLDVASLGSVTLHAQSDSGKLFVYGSIVDNKSGDPVFFAGQ